MARPVECGFTKIGMDRVVKELVKFKQMMDEINEPFFLVAGVLLGVVRDNALISCDKDFDLGVMGDEPLYRMLDSFKVYYDEAHIDSRQKKLGNANILWLKKYVGRYVIPIEIQAHYVKDDYVYYNRDLGKSWRFQEARLVWPRHLFDEFAKVEFAGEEFDVPNPPEEFLSIHYGEDWKTPKEYTDWRFHCANIQRGLWT